MSSLDPHDKELFQSAVDAVCSRVNADEIDSDEELEAALRCELLSIACVNGVSDPEHLLELVFGVCEAIDDASEEEMTLEEITAEIQQLLTHRPKIDRAWM